MYQSVVGWKTNLLAAFEYKKAEFRAERLRAALCQGQQRHRQKQHWDCSVLILTTRDCLRYGTGLCGHLAQPSLASQSSDISPSVTCGTWICIKRENRAQIIPHKTLANEYSEISVMATGLLMQQPEEKRVPQPFLGNLSEISLKKPPNVRAGSQKTWLQPPPSHQQISSGRILLRARLAVAWADVSGSFITLELLDVFS